MLLLKRNQDECKLNDFSKCSIVLINQLKNCYIEKCSAYIQLLRGMILNKL